MTVIKGKAIGPMENDSPLFTGSIQRVEDGWIDFNGHMNMACYAIPFDRAVEEFLSANDAGAEYRERSGNSFFSLAATTHYLRELKAGAPLRLTLQLLDVDEKRLHFFMEMHHAGENFRAATMEWLIIHIDMSKRRSSPMPEEMRRRFMSLLEEHSKLPRPPEVGARIGIRRRPSAEKPSAGDQ